MTAAGRLAERADATGISDTATQRTGSVVEALIAPDAAAGPDAIVHVPVKYVVPHPRNRKILDGDVDDLVAEFKAGVPILNPLGVTAAADWNANRPAELKEISPLEFIITAGGHRRLRAAELAGLPTVPCVVRADFAGAEGRKAALLENLHRQDLDAFEEAAAFDELTSEPYKLSQRDLAGIVGCNQSHISKRLKLLKLPSTVRESVRLDRLTIADAIALAGVVDNKPVFDDALDKVTRYHWHGKEAVARAQHAYDIKITRQRLAEKLTADGVTILDRRPAWYAASKTEPTRLSDLHLDEDKHTGEECHAAYIDDASFDGEVKAHPVCQRPGRHTKTGVSTLKVRKSIDETLNRRGSNDAEAEARRERRDHKKLWPARAEAARQVALDPQLGGNVEAELVTRGVLGNTFDDCGSADTWKALVAILEVDDTVGYPNEQAREALINRYPARTVQRAVALSYFEARLRSTWKTWGSDGKYYLDLLADHGYTVDRLEKKKLGKVKAHTAGPTCRVCNAQQLEPGVTWVADDLCSGCSDATEAGWVAADTAASVLSHTACLECEHDQPTDSCACPHCFCNPANVDEPTTAVAG